MLESILRKARSKLFYQRYFKALFWVLFYLTSTQTICFCSTTINRAKLHNYADDNNVTSKTLSNLIEVLKEEAGVALTWLKQNQMITDPEKFHALLLSEKQTNTSGGDFNIQGKVIKSEETV